MEWTPVFKRNFTAREKEIIIFLVVKYKEKAKEHITNTNSKKVYVNWFEKDDKERLNKIYSETLCDYSGLGSIIYSKKKDTILQPEKKWSATFSGVAPILLKNIVKNNIIVKPNYSILNNN